MAPEYIANNKGDIFESIPQQTDPRIDVIAGATSDARLSYLSQSVQSVSFVIAGNLWLLSASRELFDIDNYAASIIQVVIVLFYLGYFVREDLQNEHKNQPSDFYPTPKPLAIESNRKFSSFNNGVLLISLQIAILLYVTSALSFTPHYHNDDIINL